MLKFKTKRTSKNTIPLSDHYSQPGSSATPTILYAFSVSFVVIIRASAGGDLPTLIGSSARIAFTVFIAIADLLFVCIFLCHSRYDLLCFLIISSASC